MPHVIDPATNIIFCEGQPGSLDVMLLRHLVPIGGVLIQPVGGKHAMRAFIEGYLGNYVNAQPEYLGFRDRDFDVEPPMQTRLIRLRGEKPIWLCHRAAIENYMIGTDLIHQYWEEREKAPGWAHGPAMSSEEIQSHIRESARALADYQAVRWALSRLKPGLRWPEINTTWTRNGSGDLPSSLGYQDCLAQACHLVESFLDQVQNVNVNELHSWANTYRDQFNDDDFYQEHKYLIWFHGKDHLVQLCRRLAPSFPRRNYVNWAAEHIDISKHPDLEQLVALID
jgi:hypothetical protein